MKTITTIKIFVSLFVLALCLGTSCTAQSQQTSRPDLTIPWIAASNYTTTTVIRGRTTTFHWTKAIIFVRNIGTVASPASHVRLQIRDWATQRVLSTYIARVPSIAAGATNEVDLIQPLTVVNFTDINTYLFGFADCNSEVLESNENNNTGYSGMGGQGG